MGRPHGTEIGVFPGMFNGSSLAFNWVALAVYLLVNLWPETSMGATREYTRLEAMVLAGKNDPQKFESLLSEYRRLKLFQEEIWALYDAGRTTEAARLEDRLKERLLTEEVAHVAQRELSPRVERARLTSGVQAVMRTARLTEGVLDREVLVYEIDRILGFHLVPVTVKTKMLGIPISLQAFVKNKVYGKIDFRVVPYQDERLHILDFITRQEDRHGENWAYAPGGRLFAYDNNFYSSLEPTVTWAKGKEFRSTHPPRRISAIHRKGVLRLQSELRNPKSSLVIEEPMRDFFLARIGTLLELPEDCEGDLR